LRILWDSLGYLFVCWGSWLRKFLKKMHNNIEKIKSYSVNRSNWPHSTFLTASIYICWYANLPKIDWYSMRAKLKTQRCCIYLCKFYSNIFFLKWHRQTSWGNKIIHVMKGFISITWHLLSGEKYLEKLKKWKLKFFKKWKFKKKWKF